MNVLVFDRDEAAARAAAQALEASHAVRVAHTIEQAQKLARDTQPDAVVCELEGGGDALLAWLRQHQPSVRRIVYCSKARPEAFDVDLAHAWVLKPDILRVLWLLRPPIATAR